MKIKEHEITKNELIIIILAILSAAVVIYMYFCPAEWFIVFFIMVIFLYLAVAYFLRSEYHYTSKLGNYTKLALLFVGFESTLGFSTVLRFYQLGINEIPIFFAILIALNGYLLWTTHKYSKLAMKNNSLSTK